MKASINFGRPVAAAFGLAAFLAIPAQAADAIIEPPPAPPAAPVVIEPVNTWSGPYAGITLGYGFESETSVGDSALPGVDLDTEGFTAHGFAGWNGQSGALVYGVEGDVGYSGVEGEDGGVEVEGGVDGSLRARLGYAVTENVLVYGTGGGAARHTEISDAAGSDSNTMLGYTVGAGVDTKLTENVFGRLEYRYTDYGSETFNTGSGDRDVESQENRIGVGLGIQF